MNEELMGAIPNGSRVLIRLPEPEKKTSSGIIIPEAAQKEYNDGKKAVGGKVSLRHQRKSARGL